MCLILVLALMFDCRCLCSLVCSHVMLSILHDISFHTQIYHHFNICIYSCIIVTQPSESESVEPTEVAEAEPGVEFFVEPKKNQDKQLSMIPHTHLIWFNLVISFRYYWIIHIMFIYCILVPTFMHYPFLVLIILVLVTC